MPNPVMSDTCRAAASKRVVKRALSDRMVVQAQGYTANPSAMVEALLIDSVAAQQRAQARRKQQPNGWCADWNAVHASVGSFAEEHQPL